MIYKSMYLPVCQDRQFLSPCGKSLCFSYLWSTSSLTAGASAAVHLRYTGTIGSHKRHILLQLSQLLAVQKAADQKIHIG